MRKQLRAGLGVLGVAIAVAGCGSTAVEYPTALVGPGGSTGVAASGGELGTTGTGGGSGVVATSGGTTGLSLGTTGSSGGATSTTGGFGTTGSTSGAGSTSGGGPNGNVRGVTKTSVLVGMTYSSDAARFQTTLNPNAVPGDPVAIAKTVINHINAEGGVLGRKLEGVFYDQPISSQASNPAGTASAACTYFTQDRPVAWVILNTATNIDTACLAKAKMPTFELNLVSADATFMKPLIPYYHLSGSADPARYMPVFVDRLKAQGYFSGWNTTTQQPDSSTPKIGVYLQDTPLHHRIVDNFLKPALKRQGYTIVAQFAGDPSPFARASQENSAVLQFRQAGVTHLFTLGPMVYTGAKGADGYHYRLAVMSENGTAGLAGGAPEGVAGAMGVGWLPYADVGPKGDGAASPATNKCLGWINKDLGYDVVNQPDRYGSAATKCDAFIVFAEAMKAAGGYTSQAIQAGLSKTFGKTPTAFMASQGFTADRFYGAGVVRDVAYAPSCKCFRYGSAVTKL
jgi:ABC-type branched-subunit amino acid transport system substrate-binding protein